MVQKNSAKMVRSSFVKQQQTKDLHVANGIGIPQICRNRLKLPAAVNQYQLPRIFVSKAGVIARTHQYA
jgi:hypothetical protein